MVLKLGNNNLSYYFIKISYAWGDTRYCDIKSRV